MASLYEQFERTNWTDPRYAAISELRETVATKSAEFRFRNVRQASDGSWVSELTGDRQYAHCPEHGSVNPAVYQVSDKWRTYDRLMLAVERHASKQSPRFTPCPECGIAAELFSIKMRRLNERSKSRTGKDGRWYCSGACLNGKTSCDCYCMGRCHGAGHCKGH